MAQTPERVCKVSHMHLGSADRLGAGHDVRDLHPAARLVEFSGLAPAMAHGFLTRDHRAVPPIYRGRFSAETLDQKTRALGSAAGVPYRQIVRQFFVTIDINPFA